ncbi:MAG: DUF4301 family protein [Muribaculaceae bacterium]|nr:DUF4301 family protein [Muribaculaceae bacterium]MDE7369624.1 DUF4301 family protein [Muribaculaceae bacterium]
MLTEKDLTLLKEKGITPEEVQQQLDRFATGFPYLVLDSTARVGNGILSLDHIAEEMAMGRWHQYLADGGTVTKFVPASGAASRMFKALFAFAEGDTDSPKPDSDVDKLLKSIHQLAFFDELDATVKRLYSKNVDQLIAEGRNRDVISAIILPDGMNYGNLPKGLLTFHRYADGSTRTPLEEQLMEGAQTATSANGDVNLHFTVSGSHKDLFKDKIKNALPAIESKTGVKFNISLSEQLPSTDTIAANADNTPFRDNGNLVFRPGGHGALIQNLNAIDTTVVFVKNIDNVVPDSFRDATLRYKKVIAGVLIQNHDLVARYIDMLRNKKYTAGDLADMVTYLNKVFCVKDDRFNSLKGDKLAELLLEKLNRPMRVCGMVRNEGEPGGGPYIARNPDGSFSPQILESTQIDMDNAGYKAMVSQATHFNPVDLVCYIRDVDGRKFDLPAHVDPATGFISSKSLHGRELKALELPGLWNGAMSDWLTIFVEVPIATFNPVKTVNDLLRPAHQG